MGPHPLREDALPLPQVLQLGIDVASAMVYLHPNIVHRDLKPQNCLLDR